MKLLASLLFGFFLSLPACADNTENNTSNLKGAILNLLQNQPYKHFYFLQEKKIALLSKPLITEGELTLQNDATSSSSNIIWDIQKPYAIRYELHRNFIKEIDTNGERTLSPGSNPLAAALTEAMIASFSGHWENNENLARIKASGKVSRWKLDIIPHSIELQKMIRSICVEGSENNINQVSIMESNDDSTIIYLKPTP